MEKIDLVIIWKNGSHGIYDFHSYDDMIKFVLEYRKDISVCWERK